MHMHVHVHVMCMCMQPRATVGPDSSGQSFGR
jgi:hypothetical protein